MMAARPSEAERLRRHKEEMKLALAEKLPLAEARRRLNARAIAEMEARHNPPLQPKDRCGTEDTGEEHPRFWWQDDRL